MANPQTVQSLFNQTAQQWVEGARLVGRKLLRTRHKITIEDVLEVWPRPSYLHRNTTGKVFQSHMFHAIGYTRARKPSSNGRVIRWWTLSDMYADEYGQDCE